MKNRTDVFPCRVRQGFFALMAFFAVSTFATPQVGYTIIKSGSSCNVRISGCNIGAIKSGEIVCEYATQLDINDALVYSPLSSITVGASVDRINHRVKLVINTTGKITIDNTEMIIIELKLSGSEAMPVFGLTSALFTDTQGVVKSAQILPVGVIVENRIQHSIYSRGNQDLKSYLLNGKAVKQEIAERFRNEMIRGDVFLRIVTPKLGDR
jgi:hypothetical protein